MTQEHKRGVLATAVILMIFVCLIVTGTYWATGPALRCNDPAQGPAQAGWSARTVNSGGLERCYYLYVPVAADLTRSMPVVLSFHGFLSNPDSHALISGWHQLADREGFLVVYPQGRKFPQRWNAGATWGNSEVDDVQFYRDMLADLSTVTAVDRMRVYVNGFSNGGGMTVRIACEAADTVAAIGSVAGAVVDTENCAPSRPVPVMAFHGTSDPIVNYEGGLMKGSLLRWGAGATHAPTFFLGAEEWVAAWAEGNGCEPVANGIPKQGDVRGIRYTGCDQGADVILYTVEDGGHTWPGGTPIPGVGKTSDDIHATEEMWKFFEQYQQ